MKRNILVALLVMCFGLLNASAQKDQFKGTFMFNIARLIDWPSDYKNGDFVIAILGSSPEVEKELGNKTMETQQIVTSEISSPNDLDKCHVLFITSDQGGSLPQVLKKFKGYPTLIISDSPGLAEAGSCINFVKNGGKLDIEISKVNIETQGLKVSSDLLSLGTLVD